MKTVIQDIVWRVMRDQEKAGFLGEGILDSITNTYYLLLLYRTHFIDINSFHSHTSPIIIPHNRRRN